jgi:hypothetical protein
MLSIGCAPAKAAPPKFSPVRISLPDNIELFTGDNSEAINNNCLACHSAEMILNQPRFPRTVWDAEVQKMIATYKAPIPPEDRDQIVDYLCKLKCP